MTRESVRVFTGLFRICKVVSRKRKQEVREDAEEFGRVASVVDDSLFQRRVWFENAESDSIFLLPDRWKQTECHQCEKRDHGIVLRASFESDNEIGMINPANLVNLSEESCLSNNTNQRV